MHLRGTIGVLILTCLPALVAGLNPAATAAQLSLPQTGVVGQTERSVEESLAAELEAVEANGALDDTAKASLKETLQRAKKAADQAKVNRELVQQYQQAVETTPTSRDALQQRVETAAGESKAEIAIPPEATIEELTARLSKATAALGEATKSVSEATTEPARRRSRSAEIPELIAKARQELEDVEEQRDQPPPANESELQSRVRRLLLAARGEELTTRIAALENEQQAYSATSDLLPLQRRLAEANVQQRRREVEALQAAISAKQKQQMEQTSDELRKTAADVPTPLKELAEKNYALAASREQLLEDETTSERQLLDVETQLEQMRANREVAEERIDAVGLTDALGLLLRQQRQQAETLRYEFRPRSDLGDTTREYQIRTFQLEDELTEIETQLAKRDAPDVDWESDAIPWDQLSLEDAEWILLRKRRQLIEETLQAQNELLQTLLISDTQRRQLIQSVDEFTTFIDQHLFWTRSAPAISVAEFRAAPRALAWVLDPIGWQNVLTQMVSTTGSHPVSSLLLALFTVGLLLARPRLRQLVRDHGQAAKRLSATFRLTLVTLIATVLDATVWPAVFATAGFLLLATPSGDPLVRGVGQAVAAVAIFTWSRELLRHVCRDGGLADAHFGWSAPVRKHLRRHLRWYTVFGCCCIIPLAIFHAHPDATLRSFVTRLATTLVFVIVALFHHAVLRSQSPLYPQLIRLNPDSKIYRYHKVIWGTTVFVPAAIALMALAGYLETTFRLGRSLQTTFWMVLVVILAAGLISRFMMLRKRELARRRAMELRAKKLAADEVDDVAAVANEAGIVLHEEDGHDLDTLDAKSRQTALVSASVLGLVGLVYIWSDLIPAIGYFDEMEWFSVGTGDTIQSVTALDVFYAVAVLAIMVYATRAFPPLFEFLVLGRTSLDAGARYAIVTLMRYVIVVVGMLIVFSLLSVPYNQLGWLLAAISVGLGFGLQEIVANFVSGIILLLERPVRVGDVVTIDDTTGIVSRIQMRATTVTNWDRKELVIPNKDLITQKLLNWSLSNFINRLTLNVGVAYGTDPDKVREILLRVVREHPAVLDDPAPLINFETFGDSSLNFAVRFFLEKLDQRIEVTHQVNTAIAHAFQEAGIEIPFPQRDLHVEFTDRNGSPVMPGRMESVGK